MDYNLPLHTLQEFEQDMYPCLDKGDLKPVFKGCKNAICLVSSDEYAPYASVVIAGIIANASKDEKYDIVILTKDMTIKNLYIIAQMALNHENISIRIKNVCDLISGLNFYTWAHFTIDTYLRLLIPSIFNQYERVLYLDSDIVVNHDVSELIKTDFQGAYMAATYDTHVVSFNHFMKDYKKYNIETLGMEDPDKYFQMGVSLFNIKKINNDFKPDFLIKSASQIQLKWLDQDFLNKTFYGKIKPFANKWNVMICNQYPYLDEWYLPDVQRKEYAEARRDPYIIHYVGHCAPCFVLTPDLWTYFWKYARLSPYYEIILQKMSLTCAHMYNIDYVSKHKKTTLYAYLKYNFYRIMQHLTGSKKWREKRKLLKKG